MKKKSQNSSLFQSLSKGLNEAIDYEENLNSRNLKSSLFEIPEIPKYKGKEIKKIREKLHLTQSLFAQTLGVSSKTVEAWESGKNIPQGPAQRVLSIMNSNDRALEHLGIKII